MSPTRPTLNSLADSILLVEEIVGRTPSETLQKIYKIPESNSTLEFLTMLALTNGRLLKVSISAFIQMSSDSVSTRVERQT